MKICYILPYKINDYIILFIVNNKVFYVIKILLVKNASVVNIIALCIGNSQLSNHIDLTS